MSAHLLALLLSLVLLVSSSPLAPAGPAPLAAPAAEPSPTAVARGGPGSGSPWVKSAGLAARAPDSEIAAVLASAIQVAVGQMHTCALTTAGGVKCWGAGWLGALGDGTGRARHTPTDVVGLMSGVVAITAGASHTCALTAGGGVKCWGGNTYGELGDGTMTFRLAPVDVIGLASGIAALEAGDQHTCALTAGGGVKCWGDNSGGGLGDGTTAVARTTPVDVVGLATGVAAVSAGQTHSCALTSGGGVKCWGSNNSGELGNDTNGYSSTPVEVIGLASGVKAVTAGGQHTCARTTAGGAKCWGYNRYGQVGDGTTWTRWRPTDVTGLASGVVALEAGDQHTCAVTVGGGAQCWGWNSYGELGDGTRTSRDVAVDVVGLAGGIAALSADLWHTCALTGGSGVKCWGLNADGQLGDGTTTNRMTPVRVTGLTSGIAAVAAGARHTCALSAGGAVKCWGSGGSGKLGDGSLADHSAPVGVIGLSSGVRALAAGEEHSCAVTAGGGVKCWGYNGVGQLGDGTRLNRLEPVDVVGLASGVVKLAAGYGHTCALTDSGGMKCWGSGGHGQLGDGTDASHGTPVDVTGLTSRVVAVATGGWHTCAVTAGGGARCWGWNSYGNLGDGTRTDRWTPADVSGLSSGVAELAAGQYHTCALLKSGGVKCWGNNADGELGAGDPEAQRRTPVDVSGLASGVVALDAGYAHTCAVMAGGGVKCWGPGLSGQLGDGRGLNRGTPTAVTGLAGAAAAIAAGGIHSCALLAGGAVECWGSNYEGELGVNPGWTPVDVVGLGGVRYAIAGRVADREGHGIAGVAISANGSGPVMSDAGGAYMFTELPAGAYTLSPDEDGYVFAPAARAVTVPPDAAGADFVGTPVSVRALLPAVVSGQ